MPVTFPALKSNFPIRPKAELFSSMGGERPSLINNSDYDNTCCVRLSLALAGAGVAIPAHYKEAITGTGMPLIIKFIAMGNSLKRNLASRRGECPRAPARRSVREQFPRGQAFWFITSLGKTPLATSICGPIPILSAPAISPISPMDSR